MLCQLLRVVLALLMGAGVVAHVYLNTVPKPLIYMTNQVRVFPMSGLKFLCFKSSSRQLPC